MRLQRASKGGWASNEIDINTFIAGMDVLQPDGRKYKQRGDDIGYV